MPEAKVPKGKAIRRLVLSIGPISRLFLKLRTGNSPLNTHD